MTQLREGSNQFSLAEAKRIIALLNNSYSDYLSSRVLYNNELLIPATILANTALEKFFKAYLEAMGLKINIQHDPFKIFQTIKKESPTIAARINEGYLAELTKIYRSKYLENVSPGYNFVVLRRKYLAELDYTFSVLEPLLRFGNSRTGQVGRLQYQEDLQQSDPRLLHDNYVLKNESKDSFVEAIDLVHEFRMIFTHEILEAKYFTQASKNDRCFSYKGFLPGEDNRSFDLSHLPLGQQTNCP